MFLVATTRIPIKTRNNEANKIGEVQIISVLTHLSFLLLLLFNGFGCENNGFLFFTELQFRTDKAT